MLATASLGVVLALLASTSVNPAVPDIQREFDDSSLADVSWVLNVSNIVLCAFLVPAGRLSDLLGRRRIFVSGLLLFMLGSGLGAVAPSLATLVGARGIQAAGAALLTPASLALVLHRYGAGDRKRAVALWSAVTAAAGGLGPTFGGLMISFADWRVLFAVNVPLGMVIVVAAHRVLAESRAPGRRRIPDLTGAVVLALAIGALTLVIVEVRDWGWTSGRLLATLGLAIALGLVFIQRCRRHRSPLIDVDLLRVRSVSVANVMALLGSTAGAATLLGSVLFLIERWGYSAFEAGLAMAPAALLVAVVASAISRLVEQRDPRLFLIPSGLLTAGGLLYLVVRAGPEPDLLGVWVPAQLLIGAGNGLAASALGGAAVAAAPGGRYATAAGLNQVLRRLGSTLGVALLVALLGSQAAAGGGAGFDRGWVFAAVCALTFVPGAMLLGRVRRAEASEAERLADRERRVSATRVRPSQPAARIPAPSPPPRTLDDLFAETDLLAPFDEATRARLVSKAQVRALAAGEWLARSGDPADAVHVVRTGRLVLVDEEGSGRGVEVGALGRGDTVGEQALLAGTAHRTSVRAQRSSEVVRLEAEDLLPLLTAEPEAACELLGTLARRLEARPIERLQVDAVHGAIALVALSPGMPVDRLAEHLTDQLGAFGRAGVVRSGPPGWSGESPESAWKEALAWAEDAHEHVVIVGGAVDGQDAWSRFCLDHAERVLALCGTGDPLAHLVDHPRLRGCDLVLCGPPQPGGAAAWLDAFEPRATHRLEPGGDLRAGAGRIARRLTGHSVGIVLSGGGARCLMQIGVLEELTAQGVEIDRVGGSSIGAFIGALFAQGLTADEIDAHCYDEWIRHSPLRHVRPSRVSLLGDQRALAMLGRLFPGAIEELPRDFFCVTTDLMTGEFIVHRRGPLALPLGGTLALPGLTPPAHHEGRILFGGNIIDDLPVAAMAATGEGPVIACDLFLHYQGPDAIEDRDAQASFAPLRDDPTPSMGEAFLRSYQLAMASRAEVARRQASLVIAPRNDGVGILEFHQIDTLRETGREAAAQALEESPEALGF